VPNELFGASYQATSAAAINWLLKAEKSKLACANDLYWLIRPSSTVCWNEADFDAFLATAVKQWNRWPD
jgi:hypothetical protein